MRTSVAAIALWLAGCGAPEPNVVRLGSAPVDSAANAEVWAFEAAWGYQVTGVAVQFTNNLEVLAGDTDTVGLCVRDGATTVWLDAEWWADATPECREALVFHELGHGVLDRDHSDVVSDTGRPLSVMHTTITQVCWAWRRYREDYVAELFGR